MDDELPPNPYITLGVAQDADEQTIKSTYKKLCLKTHPDKFLDEEVKKQKQEEFQKIQQAYEILGDEKKRREYDEALKRIEKVRAAFKTKTGGSAGVNIFTSASSYGIRTQAPKGSNFPPPPREERTPHRSASYEDDRFFENSPRYESSSKSSRTPPRSSRDKEKESSRPSGDRTRSDARKAQAREERRERSDKFVYVEDESSADEKARYEEKWRKEKERRREEDHKRHDSHRRGDDRRSAEELPRSKHRDTTHDKTRELEREALRHMTRTTAAREARPTEYYTRRGSEAPRRSAARPKDSPRPMSSGRDRGVYPEIVSWGQDDDMERRVPLPTTLKPSVSSPADIRMPQRSYTEVRDPRRRDVSPTPPTMKRSETMPTVHTSSNSRRRDPSASRFDAGYSSTTPEAVYASIPLPTSSTKIYSYTHGSGGVRLAENVEIANGHRAVHREPKRDSERLRTRSPSPISRPPIGKHRMEYVKPKAPQPPRSGQTIPPTLGRSASSRDHLLFNEIPDSGYVHRAPAYVDPESVKYSKRYGPDDVHYTTGRGPERDRGAYRPSLRKHETSVY